MPAFLFRAVAASAGLGASVFLSGCATESASGGTVKATDTACVVSTEQVESGAQTFTMTNTGSKVTEIEFLAADDRAIGELENLGPGTTRDLTVDLPAGDYQVACKPEMKGQGIRSKLTVTGTQTTTPLDPTLATAVAKYRQYVNDQADLAITNTTPFVAAVKAGNVAEAKRLYVASRQPWERIEPIAESFGDLDPRMDAREADLEEGQKWTGWHRLEKDLWNQGLQPDSSAIADQLATDLQELKTNVDTVEMTPSQISNGAQGLLDEVATGKVTGEEEAFSHTDLADFEANVVGAQVAIDDLRPYLQTHDAELLATLDTRFNDILTDLHQYQQGETFASYTTLSQTQIKSLADKVDALSEPLSQVTGVITGQ